MKYLAFLILAGIVLLLPSSAHAFDLFKDPCKDAAASQNLPPTCQQKTAQQVNNTNPVVNIIQKAVNLIAVVAGIAAVIVIIVSGFMFVTAGGVAPGQRAGDPNRVKSAQSTLTGAIIGLVIIAMSWALVTFVTETFIK